MKKRIFKGIAATILTVMMIGVSTIGSMAATPDMDAPGYKDTTENTIALKKGIVLYNTEGNNIYLPQITYNYAISPVDVTDNTPTVTDDAGNKGTVKDGVADGVALSNTTVTFNNTETNAAAAAGTEVTKDIVVSVDTSKFGKKAGIYRYQITETIDTDTLTAKGITRPSGYISTRYLDVYLGNNTAGDDVEVKGYVCFISDTKDRIIDGNNSTNNTITAKTAGFVDTKDIDASRGTTDPVKENADKYYTYNVSVGKTVTGVMGDKTHEFRFDVNTSGVTGQPISVTTTGTHVTLASADAGAVDGSKKGLLGTAIGVTLMHSKEVKLIGLPANTSITQVQETNNSPDTYTTDIKHGSDQEVAATSIVPNNTTAAITAKAVSNYATYATTGLAQNATAYTVTNDLTQISPTGLMFRYAPYILLIGAALFLLAAMGRRKEEVE